MSAPAPSSQPKGETLRHTPLPWKIRAESPEAIFGGDERGSKVAATKSGHNFPDDMGDVPAANAALIVAAVNPHAALSSRIAELEANERAYEAALGQRTYNEVAELIAGLEGKLLQVSLLADNCVNADRYTAEDALEDLQAIRRVILRAALTSHPEVSRG